MASPDASPVLTATEAQDLAYQYSPQKAMTETLTFLAVLFAIFYFILIRPQQKKIKAHQAMLGALQKGDKVMTAGGIIGKIVKIEENVATVEIAQGVQIQIAKAMIGELMK